MLDTHSMTTLVATPLAIVPVWPLTGVQVLPKGCPTTLTLYWVPTSSEPKVKGSGSGSSVGWDGWAPRKLAASSGLVLYASVMLRPPPRP
jgi:hypothetical protein